MTYVAYVINHISHINYKKAGLLSLFAFALLGEEVADLGEELLFVGGLGSGGRCLFFLFLELHDHAQGHEDAEGDDEEVDDVLDKHAVVDGHFLHGCLPFGGGVAALFKHPFQGFEVAGVAESGKNGHDDVVDDRGGR